MVGWVIGWVVGWVGNTHNTHTHFSSGVIHIGGAGPSDPSHSFTVVHNVQTGPNAVTGVHAVCW